MKKLIVLILFLVSLKSIGQTPPVNGSFGSPNTATLTKGVPVTDSGYWFRFSFADTITANYGILDNCPGIMIRVGDTTYIRSNAANKWLNMMRGGGSGSTPSLQQATTVGDTTNVGIRVQHLGSTVIHLSSGSPFGGHLDINTVGGGNNISLDGQYGNIEFDGALMPARDAGSADEVLVSDGANSPPIWTPQSELSLIDTVEDYDAMRKYEGDAIVLVNVDSRTGGLFYKVSSGTENGATIIVDDLGGIWERQWDKVNYKPEFYQIFGKDINGDAYDRLTGEGIGSEADAIINISLLAGDSGIIQYIPGKEYPIDRSVTYIYNNQKHTGGYQKRTAPITTLLVNNESIGSTSIEVTDASQFQAGMNIVIKGAGTNGGFGDNSVGTGGNDYHLITAISGNTLTIQSGAKAINKAMLAGDTVVTVSSFTIRTLNAAYTNEFIFLENMEYDGNKTENYQFLDYQVNAGINNLSGYTTAYNCTWRNSPGENMYLAGGRITNCFAYQLVGSFAHSSNDGQTLDSTYLELIVENLYADSIGLGNSEDQGHSEAALFVGSTKSSNSIWKNCTVQNAGGASGPAKQLWGLMTADDAIVQVYGGYYERSRALLAFNGIDSLTAKGRQMIIQNATFKNCGTFLLAGTDIRKGNGPNGIVINENTFVNTRFLFNELVNLQFTNNIVMMDSATYGRWDNTIANGTGSTTWSENYTVLFVGSETDRITITGNSFSGFVNDTINICLQIVLSNSVVTKVGSTNTLFYYGQNFDISNNKLNFFRYGLNTGLTAYTKSTVGWQINDNVVVMGSGSPYASDYTWGLRIPPGAIANNNTVYNFFNTNYSWPLVAEGIFPDGAGNETMLMGATLTNNKTFGLANHSIYISPFDNSPYNVVLKNNLRESGAISAGAIGLAASFRSGNDILDATNLPYLTAPITPIGHRVLENKSNY